MTLSGVCVSAGLSEAMLRPGSWSLGDKGTHYIKTIKNSSNHLATLINDILDAAAMAKGKLVIKQETVCCCLLAVYSLSTHCLLTVYLLEAGLPVLLSTCCPLAVYLLSTYYLILIGILYMAYPNRCQHNYTPAEAKALPQLAACLLSACSKLDYLCCCLLAVCLLFSIGDTNSHHTALRKSSKPNRA